MKRIKNALKREYKFYNAKYFCKSGLHNNTEIQFNGYWVTFDSNVYFAAFIMSGAEAGDLVYVPQPDVDAIVLAAAQ